MSNNPFWILWTFSYGMASSFVRLGRPTVNSEGRERVSLLPVPPRAYHHVCHTRQAQRMFAGYVDGFCRHLMIYTVLRHPLSYYLIFQKALAQKGKLISLSLFNWWWYAGHTKAAIIFFLLKIIMDSYSLPEQNPAEFHTLLLALAHKSA